MSTVIKELIAKFTADYSGIDNASKKAEKLITDFGKKASFAATAAAAGFAYLTASQMKAGDALGKTARYMGIATDTAAGFELAAKLADTTVSTLAARLDFLNKQLIEIANGGGGPAAGALAAIGVSAKELMNLPADERLKKISEALRGVEDANLRSAAAQALFGRGAREMADLLNGGAAALDEAKQKAIEYGLAISEVDAAALDITNDSLEESQQRVVGLARVTAVQLSPAVYGLSEAFKASLPTASDYSIMLEEIGSKAIKAADTIYKYLKPAISVLGQEMAKRYAEFTGQGDLAPFINAAGAEDRASGGGLTLQQKMASARIEIERQAQNQAIRNATKKGGGGDESFLAKWESGAKSAKDALNEFNKASEEAIKRQQDLGNAVADTAIQIKDGFLQGGNVLRNFGQIALNVLNDVANNMLRVSLGGTSGGGIGGILAQGIMGAFGMGNVTRGYLNMPASQAFGKINWNASGGVTSGRTIFPSSGGMQGAGEMGTEGILPLKRINGKLGVSTDGGGGVVQNITIHAGVSQTVRAEMMRLMPQIRAEAVRAVTENNARGINP